MYTNTPEDTKRQIKNLMTTAGIFVATVAVHILASIPNVTLPL